MKKEASAKRACSMPAFFLIGLCSERLMLIMVRVQAGIPKCAGNCQVLFPAPQASMLDPSHKNRRFLNGILCISESGLKRMSDWGQKSGETLCYTGLGLVKCGERVSVCFICH